MQLKEEGKPLELPSHLLMLLVQTHLEQGRLVMIGDKRFAATTPHILPSGAWIGQLESGIVWQKNWRRNDDVQVALDKFHDRRWDAFRMVVENSAPLVPYRRLNGANKPNTQKLWDSTK